MRAPVPQALEVEALKERCKEQQAELALLRLELQEALDARVGRHAVGWLVQTHACSRPVQRLPCVRQCKQAITCRAG